MPRIVRFHETGGPDVLAIEERPLETPGKGEVRLKVDAFGLNRAEALFRQGLYLENPELPSRLGYEAAGVVDAVGPGVAGIAVGDRVSTMPSFSMTRYGVYGESAVVPADAAASYPAHLSPIQGAAIWMPYLTAYGALMVIGRLEAGQAALITAASSSVGLAAIQIAKSVGALAVATTRGPDKKAALLAAGADHVIVTDREDVAESLKSATGRGADIVLDPVAGPFMEDLARAAAPGGIVVAYGALSMAPTPFPLVAAMRKGLTVRGYLVFEILKRPDLLAVAKQFVCDGLENGVLTPAVDRTFPLESIVEAHRYLESNRQKGKIVVTV